MPFAGLHIIIDNARAHDLHHYGKCGRFFRITDRADSMEIEAEAFALLRPPVEKLAEGRSDAI